MMDDRDIAYFQRRLIEERKLAANPADEAVCAVHRRLAERYEQLLQSAQEPAGNKEMNGTPVLSVRPPIRS